MHNRLFQLFLKNKKFKSTAAFHTYLNVIEKNKAKKKVPKSQAPPIFLKKQRQTVKNFSLNNLLLFFLFDIRFFRLFLFVEIKNYFLYLASDWLIKNLFFLFSLFLKLLLCFFSVALIGSFCFSNFLLFFFLNKKVFLNLKFFF